MKYIFTAQFLKINPPETSFADSWEAFCADLLSIELKNEECISLNAPDRGVDIFLKNTKKAIQCKSDERGAFGTIPPAPSIESLSNASKHKDGLGWTNYAFATNANYSGNGLEQILKTADELELNRNNVIFHGPEYWSTLCEKHFEKVKNRLDYRLIYTEEEVLNAFKKARYYEDKVKEYKELIRKEAYHIEIGNNRTPISLQIPLSPSMTIEHCIDVAMQLLDLNLNSIEYPDLKTSAKPSYSITIDQVPQGFNKKLSEYTKDEISKLQLWIQIVWKDEEEKDESESYLKYNEYNNRTNLTVNRKDRGKDTLSRFESALQSRMWEAVSP